MKLKIKLVSVLIVIFMVIGVCGCSMDDEKKTKDKDEKVTEEVKVMLNERQKKILEEEGLPTEYEELTYTQKKAIVAIEEMLSAIEDKYDMEFSYIGYTDGGILDSEKLTAYPTSGDKTADAFTVTRKIEGGKYVYTDGYEALMVGPVFNGFILKYVQSALGEGNVKIYSRVTSISDKNYPIQEEDIPNNVDGDCMIFVDGSQVLEADYDTFVLSYKNWLLENRIRSATQIILVKENVLKYLTKYNYTDYLSPDYYTRRELYNSWDEVTKYRYDNK